MNPNVYAFTAVIEPVPDKHGAFVRFPHDVRQEFGKGRVKVRAVFDGEPYEGSLVNMGVKNPDGSVCYIIGVKVYAHAAAADHADVGRLPGGEAVRLEPGPLLGQQPRRQLAGPVFHRAAADGAQGLPVFQYQHFRARSPGGGAMAGDNAAQRRAPALAQLPEQGGKQLLHWPKR